MHSLFSCPPRTFLGIFLGTFVVSGAPLALLHGSARAAPPDGTLVRVRAVNHTDKHLVAFALLDPEGKSAVTGPDVEPFGRSPSLCCYEVPHQWRSGLQVQLVHDWWTGSLDERAPQTALHQLPRYAAGRPGNLWVVFRDDGSAELVMSDVEPDDPQWPGTVRGWPTPSRQYRLQQWQLEYDQQSRTVARLRERMNGLPSHELRDLWDRLQQRRPAVLKDYAGPDDPRFAQALQQEAAELLPRAQQRLEALEREKP